MTSMTMASCSPSITLSVAGTCATVTCERLPGGELEPRRCRSAITREHLRVTDRGASVIDTDPGWTKNHWPEWRRRSYGPRSLPLFPGPPQAGIHSRQQLVRVEGLDHVVVGTGTEAEHLVRGHGPRRHHDNGHAGIAGVPAKPPGHLEPVDPRHHDVKENQVWPDLLCDPQRLLAVTGHEHVVSDETQVDLDEPSDIRVVIHHKDRFEHVFPSKYHCRAFGRGG